MGVLEWIVVGLIAGWLANQILSGGSGGLLYNLAVGLVGAVVGGLIFGSLQIMPVGLSANWSAPPSAPSCFC